MFSGLGVLSAFLTYDIMGLLGYKSIISQGTSTVKSPILLFLLLLFFFFSRKSEEIKQNRSSSSNRLSKIFQICWKTAHLFMKNYRCQAEYTEIRHNPGISPCWTLKQNQNLWDYSPDNHIIVREQNKFNNWMLICGYI